MRVIADMERAEQTRSGSHNDPVPQARMTVRFAVVAGTVAENDLRIETAIIPDDGKPTDDNTHRMRKMQPFPDNRRAGNIRAGQEAIPGFQATRDPFLALFYRAGDRGGSFPPGGRDSSAARFPESEMCPEIP